MAYQKTRRRNSVDQEVYLYDDKYEVKSIEHIVKVIQASIDNIKFYIILGVIMVIAPSFALGQNFSHEEDLQNQASENKSIEKVVPEAGPPNTSGLPPYGTIFKINRPISCNDTDIVRNYIQNLSGMIPVTMGTKKNEMGAITSLIQLYVSPQNKTFTIVEHFAFRKSCIIFQGYDFDIILPEQDNDPPKSG